MTVNSLFQLGLYLAVLGACVKPLGLYMMPTTVPLGAFSSTRLAAESVSLMALTLKSLMSVTSIRKASVTLRPSRSVARIRME